MDGQIDMFGNVETSYESEIAAFRSECEKYIQSHGTGFINGKKRILDHYQDGTLTEDVLKVEYGNGGQSVRWEDGAVGLVQASPGGYECIKCRVGTHNLRIGFTWKEVKKLICQAIYEGRYIEHFQNRAKEIL